MGKLEKTALILAAIGAINWGLVALGWNAVSALITSWAGMTVETILYIIIGLSGLMALAKAVK